MRPQPRFDLMQPLKSHALLAINRLQQLCKPRGSVALIRHPYPAVNVCSTGRGGVPCTLCSRGTYAAAGNATVPHHFCTACPTGKTTAGNGSASIADCKGERVCLGTLAVRRALAGVCGCDVVQCLLEPFICCCVEAVGKLPKPLASAMATNTPTHTPKHTPTHTTTHTTPHTCTHHPSSHHLCYRRDGKCHVHPVQPRHIRRQGQRYSAIQQLHRLPQRQDHTERTLIVNRQLHR